MTIPKTTMTLGMRRSTANRTPRVRARQLSRRGAPTGPPGGGGLSGAGHPDPGDGGQALAFESKKSAALLRASWTLDLPSSAFWISTWSFAEQAL